jgi:hypothetical protein
VTGQTYSTDFPTRNPLQGKYADQTDAFVFKLTASGDALVYSTYLGGSNGDSAAAIAVDSSGDVYVTGATSSPDFPTLDPIQANFRGNNDVFVAKLNAAGNALVYSTFLGGSSDISHSGYDAGYGIAVDSSSSAYVTGVTTSTNFPTVNPIQATHAGGSSDAFISKLNAAGSGLVYSTFLGGARDDYSHQIAVDSSGNAYITGSTDSPDFPTMNAFQTAYGGGNNDAFVSELNFEGSALVYSTYLGGTDNDAGTGITVDSSGNAFVTGLTYSTGFPIHNPLQGSNAGAQDAFVAKLNAAGDALEYSTYLGGRFNEYGAGIAVDPSGSAYITGYTNSTDFPTHNPLQGSKTGAQDAFIAALDPQGSLVLSTYLGGTGGDSGSSIAVDGSGYVYLTGSTSSTDFPTLNPLQPALAGINPDAFVAKFSLAPVPGLKLSPSHLDFDGQLVGTTSAAQTMTITNIGELPLTVTSIEADGDFDVAAASAPCSTGGELGAGLSCGMSVTFAPTETGTRSGAVTIVSNAPASPYHAALSGTGTDFAVAAQSGETISATVAAGATATCNCGRRDSAARWRWLARSRT